MITKYIYYSYLQTEYKKINLTAYSDKDIGINAWNSGTRYAKLLKDVSDASTPTQRQIKAMKDGARKQLD